jgi:hypothetical protein
MTSFADKAVPFVIKGNRRALTDMQVARDAGVADFLEAFIECFERDDACCMWLFKEAD